MSYQSAHQLLYTPLLRPKSLEKHEIHSDYRCKDQGSENEGLGRHTDVCGAGGQGGAIVLGQSWDRTANQTR